MSEKEQSSKTYDLEERTFEFAKDVRRFVKGFPRTIANEEDIRQIVRASGSVGANYNHIEAPAFEREEPAPADPPEVADDWRSLRRRLQIRK